MALGVGLCCATAASAGDLRTPGDYDPATETFRLYPLPVGRATTVSLYGGILKITVSLGTSIPAGTSISSVVSAYVNDPDAAAGAGFSDSVVGTIKATGGTATATYTIPYNTLISSPSDQLVVSLDASASYTDSQGVSYSPEGFGTTTITVPKNGATTPVTVEAGL